MAKNTVPFLQARAAEAPTIGETLGTHISNVANDPHRQYLLRSDYQEDIDPDLTRLSEHIKDTFDPHIAAAYLKENVLQIRVDSFIGTYGFQTALQVTNIANSIISGLPIVYEHSLSNLMTPILATKKYIDEFNLVANVKPIIEAYKYITITELPTEVKKVVAGLNIVTEENVNTIVTKVITDIGAMTVRDNITNNYQTIVGVTGENIALSNKGAVTLWGSVAALNKQHNDWLNMGGVALNNEVNNKFSLNTHSHNTIYAALSHNHGMQYAAINHEHANLYSGLAHTHTTTYAPLIHKHSEYITVSQLASSGILSQTLVPEKKHNPLYITVEKRTELDNYSESDAKDGMHVKVIEEDAWYECALKRYYLNVTITDTPDPGYDPGDKLYFFVENRAGLDAILQKAFTGKCVFIADESVWVKYTINRIELIPSTQQAPEDTIEFVTLEDVDLYTLDLSTKTTIHILTTDEWFSMATNEYPITIFQWDIIPIPEDPYNPKYKECPTTILFENAFTFPAELDLVDGDIVNVVEESQWYKLTIINQEQYEMSWILVTLPNPPEPELPVDIDAIIEQSISKIVDTKAINLPEKTRGLLQVFYSEIELYDEKQTVTQHSVYAWTLTTEGTPDPADPLIKHVASIEELNKLENILLNEFVYVTNVATTGIPEWYQCTLVTFIPTVIGEPGEYEVTQIYTTNKGTQYTRTASGEYKEVVDNRTTDIVLVYTWGEWLRIGIKDVPVDGITYNRKDETWVPVI